MENQIKVSKGWFLAAGILLIIVGMAAISVPFIFTIALEVLVGWVLVISGIIQVAHSFKALDAGRCIIRLIGGLIYLAVGAVFLFFPLQGVMTLTLILAFLFIFEGLMKIVISLQHRPESNWVWLLVSGLAGIVIAAIIWAGWPSTSSWVIGLLVGINMIFGGMSLIMLSASLHEA
ncbi:MAG: HdeD family acid-resistance protein [Candidatus Tantalella remota]|nr:HdeD family acid-resistance protein [Candidatus Tantalella remota]